MRARYSSSVAPETQAVVQFGCLGAFLACVAAWVTHVVWIITTLASDKGATVGQMVLGVLGAFIPPIGVVHGLLIWFGVK